MRPECSGHAQLASRECVSGFPGERSRQTVFLSIAANGPRENRRGRDTARTKGVGTGLRPGESHPGFREDGGKERRENAENRGIGSWQYRLRASRFCTVTRHRRQSRELVHVDENFAVRFIGHKGSNLSRARDPRLRRERDSAESRKPFSEERHAERALCP